MEQSCLSLNYCNKSDDKSSIPKILSGKVLASEILEEIKGKLRPFEDKPRLAVITVGQKKDNESYLRSKISEAKICGIEIVVKRFPLSISEQELLKQVAVLNCDGTIDGIVVQLPLPSHIHSQTICQSLDNAKDVDGNVLFVCT